jgi:Mg2+/citrate symporter
MSLLLTATGVALSVAVTRRALRQKKNENKAISKHTEMLHNAEIDGAKIAELVDSKERYNKRRRLSFLNLMLALAILNTMLFVLLQDFRGIIVVFDWWALLHAIILACVALCGKLVFRKNENIPGMVGTVTKDSISYNQEALNEKS